MSGPRVVGAHEIDGLRTALLEDRVIVVAGVGGYQLAASSAHPGALGTLDSLLESRAPGTTPLYLLGHGEQAAALTSEWTKEARELTERVWPGPVTVMVPAGLDVARVAVRPDMSVEIGMSTNRTLRKLCREIGPLLVATMHGADGQPLMRATDVVASGDDDDIALVLDGGTCEGPGPTVVDCTVTPFVVRHQGALPESFLDATMMMSQGRRKWFSRRHTDDGTAPAEESGPEGPDGPDG